MVSNSAIKNVTTEKPIIEQPTEDFNWCTVTLSDVIKVGKRLEASVFDVESKKAQSTIEKCPLPKLKLIGAEGFVKNAHYGGRLKRNYINNADKNAVGFIGSSEMLDTKPIPVKFMASDDPKTEQAKVENGTILISRSGTIGNLTIVNNTLSKMLVSEHAIRLEGAQYPGFVYCFLKSKTGQALIKSKIYGAVIQQIEPEHLADIPVPNPITVIKEKINGLIMRSYELRDESNELIDKATRLLIEELKLPEIKEFQTEKYMQDSEINNYNVKLSCIAGRIDASYHLPIVKAIMDHLYANAGEVTTLGDKRISKEIILPGRFKRVYVEEGQGRVFFGGKQIFELDPSNKKFLSLVYHGDRIKKQLELRENMTIVTCSGTIGKVALVPKHWNNWTANQHIIRIVPASNDIAGYLSIYLSSVYGYQLITRYTYGSVVDEIDDKHVSRIAIPLLKNMEVQNTINELALEANKKRFDAYELEQEAMRIINNDVILAKSKYMDLEYNKHKISDEPRIAENPITYD